MKLNRRRHYSLGQEPVDPWDNPFPEQPEREDTTPGYEPTLQRLVPEDPLPVVQYEAPSPSPSINLMSFGKMLKPAFFAYLLLNDELPTAARAASAYFLWQWFKGEGAPVAEEIESQLPTLQRWR